MTEPRLVLKIKKALQAEGHYVAKIHGGRYSAGVPDLLICTSGEGYFIALEVKLPGKEKNVTELQAAQLRSIREAGGIAWVVSSVEDALEICGTLANLSEQSKGLVYECN
jgi:hypothetical protein